MNVELTELRHSHFCIRNSPNLNISRYISTAVREDQIDLTAIHGAVVEMEKSVLTASAKLNAFLKELGLPPLPASFLRCAGANCRLH